MLRTKKGWIPILFLSGAVGCSCFATAVAAPEDEAGTLPRSIIEQQESAAEPLEDEVGAEHMRILNKLLCGEKFTDRTGILIAGWLEQGITGNPANPSDRFNGPLIGNDRANEYQMNQLYLYLEKPVDLESGGISVGGRCDILYGTDAYLSHSLGWDDPICSTTESRFYQMAIPQLFVEFGLPVGNGLRAQFGHWYGLVSYETGLAPYDFFYSHVFGCNLVPTSHTGVLFTYNLTDQLSTSHGLHRGCDTWEDNNHQMGYTGNVAWNNKKETVFLYFGICAGPEQDETRVWQEIEAGPGEQLNRTMYSLSADIHLTERLKYIVNHDYSFQAGSPSFDTPSMKSYGLTQYLLYNLTDNVAAGTRLDVYRDAGWSATGFRTGNATSPSTYTNLTLGINIKQGKHIRWRPEVRWDWQDLDNPADVPAFNAGKSTTQFTFGTDVVVVY